MFEMGKSVADGAICQEPERMPRRSVAVPPPRVSRTMVGCAASGAASSVRAHRMRVWIGMSPPGLSRSPSKVGNGVRPRTDTDHTPGVTEITLLFRAFREGMRRREGREGREDAECKIPHLASLCPCVFAPLCLPTSKPPILLSRDSGDTGAPPRE